MRYTQKKIDLGRRKYPYVQTSALGEKIDVDLSFQRTMSRKGAEHTIFHDVNFVLTLDEAVCIGRTMIRAAKAARNRIEARANASIKSLQEAMNE